jgi:hypothetical protein
MARKRSPKPSAKKSRARKPPPKKKASVRRAARRGGKSPASVRRKTVHRKKLPPLEPDESRAADFDVVSPPPGRGLGLEAGGQAGDTAGLSRGNLADSESVEELAEEGQAFEAGVISGVEDAPDADEGEIRTKEVPADDVPKEYLDED